MKICFCNNRFPPKVVGGAELIAYELARQLRDLGHQVSILTLSDSRVSEPYVVDNLDVDSMPNTNVYNQFSHQKRGGLIKVMFGALDTLNPVAFFHALRHLRRCQSSVLCTHNLKGMGPAVWLAAGVLRIPIVHVVHDYWLVCPTSTMFKNGRACDRPCIACQRVSRPKAWLSGAVSHVVGVSKFVLDQHLLQDFFPRARCSVIHNARPPMGVGPSMPAKPHSLFRVGFIGRIDATKGIHEFFASVAAADTTDVELHVAGRDNDGVLDGLIRTHPQLKVVFHGFVNPCEFYNLVDVILVTSKWNEPFATVSFEPWEFYKPSISFAVGGLPEVYEGLPELTVPPGDVAAIGALIRRFMNDPDFYQEMAQRCRARREYFLPQRQAREFERVFLAVGGHDDKCGTAQSDA